MRSPRSGNQGGAFSLFAFQDIITSTIGAIVLIMLVLVLKITKDVTAQPETPQTKEHTESASNLEHNNDTLRRLKKVLSNGTFDESVLWIKNQIKQEQKEIDQIIETVYREMSDDSSKKEIKNLHAEIINTSNNIDELKKEVTEAIADSNSAKQLAEIRRTREQLEHRLSGILANDSLVYIKQDDPNHTPS